MNCEICGEPGVTEQIGDNLVEYDGDRRLIECLFTECLSCGCDYATPTQLDINADRMRQYKRGIDESNNHSNA